MGNGGGRSFWKPGLPVGLGSIFQHLFTCPASQKARTPHGAPHGSQHMTQMYMDRSGGRMRGRGRARMCVGMSAHVRPCGQVCMHTRVLGWKCTVRDLNTWGP